MSIFSVMRLGGSVLLIAALVLTWLQLIWPAIAALLLVGGLDITLVFFKEDTISQWIHRQFPSWGDILIMIGLCVFTWWTMGFAGLLPVLIGIIMGHLFWN